MCIRDRYDLVRTFHPRRSALGPTRQDALDRMWPRLGFSVHDDAQPPSLLADGTLDVETLFGRSAPLVVEIGPGMGEVVVAMAAADPDRDYLAVEAHVPGVANLLVMLDQLGMTNVRAAHGDAVELLTHRIQPGHVALIRSRLRLGGTLHCATDWAPYAAAMLETFAADEGLVNPFGGFTRP